MKAFAVLFAVLAASSVSASAAELIEAVASGNALFFDLDPAFGTVERRIERAKAPKIDVTVTTTGGYTLRLTGDSSDRRLKLQFSLLRKDRRPFTAKSYGISVDTASVPALKGAEFYHEGGKLTAGNRYPPVICITNSDANADLVIGFADQVEAGHILNEGAVMKLARPAPWEAIKTREVKDGIYLDLSGQYWFDALKAYTSFADDYRHFKPRPIPPQAYEPVWCSWYTLTTNINERNIWENAKIAKSLGFGTILIDGGWDTPGGDCIGYDTTYGDRVAFFGKFPNMAGLVDRIHNELGMAVELWASPWMISRKSRAHSQIDDIRTRIGDPPKGRHFLCPKCARSGDFLAAQIARVFTQYHLDGMWWDFIDSVPIAECAGPHKHDYQTFGQGYNAAMAKIVDAVHDVRPDALIEIRLGSSNINNKLFANVLETYDTPLSPDDNRGLLVYVRTMSAGCVPKTDPTMWLRSSEEGKVSPPDELVGRYMATMITAGVPAVSQDFTKMPESNKQVVKAYLDFYHAHKTDLAAADFRPVGNAKDYPHCVIEGKDAAYLYSATPAMPAFDLKRPPRIAYVFNASKEPKVSVDLGGLPAGKYAWEARDCHLAPASKGEVEVTAGRLKWDAPVPVGGMVTLTR